MGRHRDWTKAPEQACRYCGSIHPAAPQFFSKRAGTAIGVTTICLACYALKQQPLPEGMKRCGACFEVKPATDYFKRKTSKDGLRSDCKSCARADGIVRNAENLESRRAYRQANSERYAAHTARYRAADPEKAKAQYRSNWTRNRDAINANAMKRYYANHEENKAKAREHMRAFYRANPEIVRRNSLAQRTKRRTWELDFINKKFLNDLFRAQDGRCLYCRERIGWPPYRRWHLDHYIPLSKGGTNDPENLVLACQPCNNSKYNKMPWEFMPEKFSAPEEQAAD